MGAECFENWRRVFAAVDNTPGFDIPERKTIVDQEKSIEPVFKILREPNVCAQEHAQANIEGTVRISMDVQQGTERTKKEVVRNLCGEFWTEEKGVYR